MYISCCADERIFASPLVIRIVAAGKGYVRFLFKLYLLYFSAGSDFHLTLAGLIIFYFIAVTGTPAQIHR